jgi:hypothetical protein
MQAVANIIMHAINHNRCPRDMTSFRLVLDLIDDSMRHGSFFEQCSVHSAKTQNLVWLMPLSVLEQPQGTLPKHIRRAV